MLAASFWLEFKMLNYASVLFLRWNLGVYKLAV